VITRRLFLKLIGAFSLSSLLTRSSTAGMIDSVTYKNMEALTECILPGATGSGIHERVLKIISERNDPGRIFDHGMDYIERQSLNIYGKSFYMLDEEGRRSIIMKLITDSHPKSPQVFFFTKYREIVIVSYYTSKKVWKGLGYNGPPQPKGFMDYYRPVEIDNG